LKTKLHVLDKKLKAKNTIKFILWMLLAIATDRLVAQPSPSATINVIQQPCNGNGILAVNNVTGLTPPLVYTYYPGGGAAIVHSNVNSLNDTLYEIVSSIKNIYIEEMTSNPRSFYTGTVNISQPFPVNTPTLTPAVCPGKGSALIKINNNNSPKKVEWYNDTVYITTGDPVNLAAGLYTAKIFDNNGCYVFYDSININNQSPVTYSVNTIAANCTNGSASIANITGGTAPYSFEWSNGSHNSQINNLLSGSYEITVTDNQGCYNQQSIYINQAVNININTTVTNATCLQNDGQIIAFASGGTSPYQYTFSNGTNGQTASKLQGGASLKIDVVDAKGCVGETSASISVTTPINVSYSTTVSKCTQPTGSATLSISGGASPYSVLWNTFPQQTGNSITNMGAGQYDFEVTDANGCKRTGTAVIPQESILSVAINAINPTCPQTTGASFVTANGNKPPFTYLWSNGAVTDSIKNVPIGGYSCTVTDNVGCTYTKHTDISANSPLTVNFNTTASSCKYTADGSIAATIIGGTAPYTYNWSNGQTIATATNLLSDYYYLNVTDANGCSNSASDFLDYNQSDSSCFCVLKGKVYVDANSNCQYDNGETEVENIMMQCSTIGYTFTDVNGNYSFLVPSGNYSLSEVVQYFYPLSTCQSNPISITSTASNSCKIVNNFANSINPIHDVHVIRTYVNPPIPGFNYTQRLIIQNDGTVKEPSILSSSALDNQILLSGINPSQYALINSTQNTSVYNNSNSSLSLSPSQNQAFDFDYLVPTNIPLNTVLNFNDTVAYTAPIGNWLSDYTPWNNVENYTPKVIGAFDPNLKEVFPTGTGAEGFIGKKDTVMDYIIHFQNTGTYYAQKVVVFDTLDANLDWTTLKPGYSDHNYTAQVSESGVLKFTFNNIQLTWKSQSETESRGMVSYTIKLKKNLAQGTQIAKASAIYFDYNAPVITNRAISTISYTNTVSAGITNVTANDSKLIVYPNPASTEINVPSLKLGEILFINIYDIQGRVIQRIDGDNKVLIQQVNISNLLDGIYFMEIINTDGSKKSVRFIKIN